MPNVKAALECHSAPPAGHLRVVIAASTAVLLMAVTLYAIKSALGINVFAGHVPVLHSMLYPLVRG